MTPELALLLLSALPWLARGREPIEQAGSPDTRKDRSRVIPADPTPPDLHMGTIYLRAGKLVYRRASR